MSTTFDVWFQAFSNHVAVARNFAEPGQTVLEPRFPLTRVTHFGIPFFELYRIRFCNRPIPGFFFFFFFFHVDPVLKEEVFTLKNQVFNKYTKCPRTSWYLE